MPELPEVEIVKRGLEPVLVGCEVERMIFHRPDLRFPLPKGLPEELAGQVIKTVARRGKYILVFAQSGRGFVLHLGMSGVIRIERAGAEHTEEKHDHVELLMAGGDRIVFNDPRRFGFLQALEEENWQDYPAFAVMGPEPLGNGFNGKVLAEAFVGRRGPVKTALLDQRIVAGAGNIYACEALYDAGIDPRRAAGDLSEDECEVLVGALKDVLVRAIEAGGSSLRDYKHTDGKLGYFQHQFAVYGREGEPCGACDCDIGQSGGVGRIVQGGRSTFHCLRKQV